jgi:hypothetical protein
MARVFVLLLLLGCGNREPATLDLGLERRLLEAREVGSWRLDEATWRRIVVEPYRDAFADYDRQLATELPRIAQQLERGTRIETRKHFAGDDKLTTGEAWTRWALPVLADSSVATVDGAPLDAVFVHDGERWRVIAGLDRVIRARVTALDASCAPLMETPTKQCRELAWQIADAALRTQRSRFARSCALAASHCGKPPP